MYWMLILRIDIMRKKNWKCKGFAPKEKSTRYFRRPAPDAQP
jgi:hypothetical protein